jgi:hypothetical protein
MSTKQSELSLTSQSLLARPRGYLDSWKEIAVYLNRTVRTVQRWEKLEGLPVHRHRHQKGSSVIAFRDQVDHWQKGRTAKKTPSFGSGTKTGLVIAKRALQYISKYID